MLNGKLETVMEVNKSQTELKLWKRLIRELGPLNLKELANMTGINRTTLWERFTNGNMKVSELEALEGVLL